MTEEKLAEQGVLLITGQEGKYDSVVADDNGAMGMGILGFHGSNAGDLLALICKKGGKVAAWISENSKKASTWANRPATSAELPDLKAAISTDIGKACQNEMAKQYVTSNVTRAKKAGLTDDYAILYFCDFANQYGPNSKLLKTITEQTVKNGGTLEAFYQATTANTASYLTRRKRVYDTLCTLRKNNTSASESDTALSWAKNKKILLESEAGLLKNNCTVENLMIFLHRALG